MSAYAEALDLLDELDALLDELEVVEPAEEFRESVSEKAASMREWIEDHEHATSRQTAALDNMIAGCRRWLRTED